MKVGAFQIPFKMVKWYLWISKTKRDQESNCHCTGFGFSSSFSREDFLSIVIDLHSVNYVLDLHSVNYISFVCDIHKCLIKLQ